MEITLWKFHTNLSFLFTNQSVVENKKFAKKAIFLLKIYWNKFEFWVEIFVQKFSSKNCDFGLKNEI